MTTVLDYTREVKTLLPRRIVDGDTWWCYVDQGYRQLGFFEYRLHGYDTPEKQGPDVDAWEKGRARLATEVATEWWANQIRLADSRVFIRSTPDPEKYGRWLGVLWCETPKGYVSYLGWHLRDLNLAVPSDGTEGTRWRDTFGTVALG